MSHFGELVRKLRLEKGLTLEAVANKLGSHKGYVSGIETDKVNPPSVKLVKKFAKIFAQDAKRLVRLAWVDKAPDLIKQDVQVITPNPKTSGGARWNYLAAWAYALKQPGGDEAKAQQFVADLFSHVPVLDTGARGSTTTFVQRGIGDVLLAWENEAFLAMQELGKDQVEIVVPSMSILAQPPVAVVDKNVDDKGTRKVAEAYLNYLYSPEAQEIAAVNFYRPTDQAVAAKHKSEFPDVPMVTIDDTFGGWQDAQQKHFADGGVFDQIYRPGQ